MARILIVDDDVQLCKAVSMVLEKMGHASECAYTLGQAEKMLKGGDFEVIILDIRLPDGNGLDALPKLRNGPNEPEVIILSGTGDPDGAELAIRSGAWNYISKPPTMSKIQLPVERAIDYHRKKRQETRPMVLNRCGIIGESRAIESCLEIVAQAAVTDANVLITGETGTGKDLFARAIHANSRRAKGPFVVVDCAALPESIVESVLFGHERGAYTGADKRSDGLIRQAHGGTLFLDEVGELPMSIQKAFLRVLQEKRCRPVGGVREIASDFRLVAATNRDLEESVMTWKFREDLFYRLRTICIDLPPLRERPGDLEPLARHFLVNASASMGIPEKAISGEYLEGLKAYDWPGNVRELAHAIESSLSAAGGESTLWPRHLPMAIRVRLARTPLEERAGVPEAVQARGREPEGLEEEFEPMGELVTPGVDEIEEESPAPGPSLIPRLEPATLPTLKDFRQTAVDSIERHYLEKLMAASGGDIKTACDVSGLSRARLYALLKRHDVSRG